MIEPDKNQTPSEVCLAYFPGQDITSVQNIVRGHLNRTYCVTVGDNGTAQPSAVLLIQQINESVFRDVPSLMRNVTAVCELLAADAEYRRYATPLALVLTQSGDSFMRDESGVPWRAYVFLSNRSSFERCPGTGVAYEAGLLCGRFILSLTKFEVTKLAPTTPNFQDLSGRFSALERAVLRDSGSRFSDVAPQVGEIQSWAAKVQGVTDGVGLPTRVCHNDFKLNNLLFYPVGDGSWRGDAVVDLDTCMPGAITYDFGDFIRSLALAVDEDEPDLTRVVVDRAIIAAGARGFMEGCEHILTEAERSLLPSAPQALAATLAARFMTDYLDGDVYFSVRDPGQNLRRAMVALRLAECLGECEEVLTAAVSSRLP